MKRADRGIAVRLAIVLAIAVLTVISCEGDRGADRVETAGVGFDVPAGWTRLSPAELEDRHSTVETMVGNADRSALAFAMEVKGLLPQSLDSNPYGREAPMRLAALAAGLERALPRKYSEYRLVRHGMARMGTEPAVEIVYVGREGRDEVRWRRVLLASPDTERILMFGFSCPGGEEARYAADLSLIESTLQIDAD